MILSLPAMAAGLGELSLRSHLGQPFRAEIDLVAVDPAERDSLHARLASVEAHQRANVEFVPALQSLRVVLGWRTGGKPFIRITSTSTVNEPFLRFLVELGSHGGQITREYTVLLDPPAQERRAVVNLPAAATGDEPARDRQGAGGGGNEHRSAPRPPRPDRRHDALDASANQGVYVVQPGDSLSQIALEQRPEGVSLQRMMAALHRANEEAFIGGNINLLVAGRSLRIPTIEELQATEQVEGRRAERPPSATSAAGTMHARTDPVAPRQVPSVDDSSMAPDTEIRSSRLERLEPPPKPAARPRDRLTLASPPPAAPDPGAEAAERLVQRQRARVFELENRMDELLQTLKQANERIGQLNRELDTMAARRGASSGPDASVRSLESSKAPSDRTAATRNADPVAGAANPPERAANNSIVPSPASTPAMVPPALVLPGAAAAEADPALRTFADRARGRLVPIVGSLVVLLGVLLLAVRWWLRARFTAADEGAVYSGEAVDEMLGVRKDEDHWQPLAPDAADAMVTTEVDLNIGDSAHEQDKKGSPAQSLADDDGKSASRDEPTEAVSPSPLANWSARLLSAHRGAASTRPRSSR